MHNKYSTIHINKFVCIYHLSRKSEKGREKEWREQKKRSWKLTRGAILCVSLRNYRILLFLIFYSRRSMTLLAAGTMSRPDNEDGSGRHTISTKRPTLQVSSLLRNVSECAHTVL